MKIIINAKIDDTNELYNLYHTNKIEKIVLSKDDILNKNLDKINLDGKILIPGGIDSHVHFNDPGFTHQEDFTTGTTSAALGGVTTIVDMPCTSMPPVTNKANLLNKLEKIEKKAVVDFAFWGGINGGDEINLNTLKELKESGATAFKIYTISGMPSYQALSYAKIDKLCP